MTAPGTRFTYSDVNYLLLGKLVEQLSGMSLDQFAQKLTGDGDKVLARYQH